MGCVSALSKGIDCMAFLINGKQESVCKSTAEIQILLTSVTSQTQDSVLLDKASIVLL